MPDDNELGLETLLEVKTGMGFDLDDDLLKACFEIQKKYQFSHDRTLSTQAMDRLIEDRVEKIGREQPKDGA